MKIAYLFYSMILFQSLCAMDDSEIGTELQLLNVTESVSEKELFGPDHSIRIEAQNCCKAFCLKMIYFNPEKKITVTKKLGGVLSEKTSQIINTSDDLLRLKRPLTIFLGIKSGFESCCITANRPAKIILTAKTAEYEINEIGTYHIEQISCDRVKLVKKTQFWDTEIKPKVSE